MALLYSIALLPTPQIFYSVTSTFFLGRILALTAYTALIVCALLSVDAPQVSQHFLDDVSFRAAWVTATQIPLVYMLSTKRGPINILAGFSHERINWVHGWVSRLLFLSATVHMAIMNSSISTRKIVQSDEKGMSVVRYGVAAYVMLAWIAVSSILPLRQWSYRAFFLNHSISTLAFLFIAFQHIPIYARTPIYLSIAFVALDKCLIGYTFCRNNISVRLIKRNLSKFRRGPGRGMLVMGYPVEMMEPDITSLSLPPNGSTTIIRVCNVPFYWIPGQHVRLYIPALGAFEIHSFTPANCSNISDPPPLPPRKDVDLESIGLVSPTCTPQSNDMLFMIRAHSGLTRRLADHHSKWLSLPCPNASQPHKSLTAYVDGPYGNPPAWEEYENLIFMSTSTGVSFALSIMDYLEQLCFSYPRRLQTRHIRFIWIMRHLEPQFEATVASALDRYSTVLKESGIMVNTELYVTCARSDTGVGMFKYDPFSHLRRPALNRSASKPRLSIRNPDEIYEEWDREYEAMQLGLKNMDDVDPFGDECEYSDDEETRTLVEGQHQDDDGYSDVRLTVDETSALNESRPLSSPIRPVASRTQSQTLGTCECALIQYRRRKLRTSVKTVSFKNVSHGSRPDISYLLSTAVPRTGGVKSMIGVCSSMEVSRQVKGVVSKINLEFALGRRETGADIFTEGFI